jgi:hypothetical protein
MRTSNGASFKTLNFNALRFQQAQCKQCFAHLHGQWLTAAGAASQHSNRLTCNKTQLSQAVQSGSTDLGRASYHTFNQSVRAFRELRQKHETTLEK